MPGFARMPSLQRVFRMVILGLALGILILGSLPILFQNKMIFFPQRYPFGGRPGEGELANFKPYRTADGKQQWGYLVEPTRTTAHGEGQNPSPRFYLAFYGNAATALGMVDVFQRLANATGCGFFIVDYRGYGFNPGRPSEKGLVADALGAYDTMKKAGNFEGGVGVIGISLGGAVAFALAEERPVDELISMSTFTSIDAMARRTVPWPIYYFLRTHFPNDRRLAELLARPEGRRPRRITLLHGRLDEVVPFEMGEALAATPGAGLEFIPIEGATHNTAIDDGFEHLARIMTEPARSDP